MGTRTQVDDGFCVAPFFYDHPEDLEPRMIDNVPEWNESRQQFLNEIIRISVLPLREKQRACIALQDRQQQLGAANAKRIPDTTIPRVRIDE